MDDWLRAFVDERGKISDLVSDDYWSLSPEDCQKSISSAGNSAPGPNGIPYQAYKPVKALAAAVLHEYGEKLAQEGTLEQDLVQDFNQAWMAMLPKSATVDDPTLGPAYHPRDLRPLSIVDCYNRLMANTFNQKLVRVANEYIADTQRGFLPGRNILQNILDMDLAALESWHKRNPDAIILFDFAAAFPSLGHEYLWKCLRAIGIPEHVIRMYQSACHQDATKGNKHKIRWKSGVFVCVEVTSGVRQGCPLSPVLFVLAIEPLIWMLAKKYSDSLYRAFADDIGAVIKNIQSRWPSIIQLFTRFGSFSNLVINQKKVVVVPLWTLNTDSDEVPSWLFASLWPLAKWDSKGKYLGVFLGPGATPMDSYNGALKKLQDRLSKWKGPHFSLFHKLELWNIYIITLFSYVDQVFVQPLEVTEAILKALKSFVGGAHGWIHPVGLAHLRSWYNFPGDLKSMSSNSPEDTCESVGTGLAPEFPSGFGIKIWSPFPG